MSTVEKLDQALAILRKKGHDIGDHAVSADGKMLVGINGKLLTYPEIYVLAGI